MLGREIQVATLDGFKYIKDIKKNNFILGTNDKNIFSIDNLNKIEFIYKTSYGFKKVKNKDIEIKGITSIKNINHFDNFNFFKLDNFIIKDNINYTSEDLNIFLALLKYHILVRKYSYFNKLNLNSDKLINYKNYFKSIVKKYPYYFKIENDKVSLVNNDYFLNPLKDLIFYNLNNKVADKLLYKIFNLFRYYKLEDEPKIKLQYFNKDFLEKLLLLSCLSETKYIKVKKYITLINKPYFDILKDTKNEIKHFSNIINLDTDLNKIICLYNNTIFLYKI